MTPIIHGKLALCSSIRLGILAGLCSLSVFGQVSAVRSGSFEVGPFAGASYGIDKFRVMAGGNLTYAFKNKYVLPYFEYSYFPGIPRTISQTTSSGFSEHGKFNLPLNDIHGGVHVRMPVFKESPFVPYLVYGMGVMEFPARRESLTYTVTTSTGIGTGTATVPVPGESDFTINGGGGLRYYIGGSGKFGFRVEAKVYKPVSGAFSNNTIGKIEAGFFFQLR